MMQPRFQTIMRIEVKGIDCTYIEIVITSTAINMIKTLKEKGNGGSSLVGNQNIYKETMLIRRFQYL